MMVWDVDPDGMLHHHEEVMCSDATDDWGGTNTIDSHQTLEGTPMHTPATTTLATAPSDLELTPAPEPGMDDGTNIDDSFDENSFSTENRAFAAGGQDGGYGSNFNVTAPGNGLKLDLITQRYLPASSRQHLQAELNLNRPQHTPASISSYHIAGMAKSSSLNASKVLHLNGADEAGGWYNPIGCDRCGCPMREKYYDCDTCRADGSYKLCIDCNADHACSTVLTRITEDWRVDCTHTGRPCKSFEQCFNRRCAAPDNGPTVRSELGDVFERRDGQQEGDIETRVTPQAWDGQSAVGCKGGRVDKTHVHGGEDMHRSLGRGGSSETIASTVADGWGAPPPKTKGDYGPVSHKGLGGWGGQHEEDGESNAEVSAVGGGWNSPHAQQSGASADAASVSCGGWGAPSMQQGHCWGDATSPQVGDWRQTVPQQLACLGDAASTQVGGWGQSSEQRGGWGDEPSSFESAPTGHTPSPMQPSSKLSAAYKFLNIDPRRADRMANERILELFKAQEPDLGLAAAEKARLALGKIGAARDSLMLTEASKTHAYCHDAALRSTTARAGGSPASLYAVQGDPANAPTCVEESLRQLEHIKALLMRQSQGFPNDGLGATAARSGLSTDDTAPHIGDTRLPSELGFVRDCLMIDRASQDDCHKAVQMIDQVASPIQSQQHEARGIQSASGDPYDEVAALKRLTEELSAKLTSVEDRLASLTSHVQIEAKARLSMSDLYDKEFFRVGQDMTTTVKRIEGLHGEVPADAESLRSEMQAQSAAIAESVAEYKVQLETTETQWKSNISTYAQEKVEMAAYKELMDGNMKDMVEGLNVRNATISSLQETLGAQVKRLCAEVEILKVAEGKHKKNRPEEEQHTKTSGASNMEALKAMMVEHETQHSAIDQRLKSLEQPVGRSIRGQLEELRATTTSLDNEIEGANSRIARIEKDVAEGLNDKRLTDIELEMENVKQRRMDVDLSEVNARVDMGSDADADILTRLDRIDTRLDGLDLGNTRFLPASPAPFDFRGGRGGMCAGRGRGGLSHTRSPSTSPPPVQYPRGRGGRGRGGLNHVRSPSISPPRYGGRGDRRDGVRGGRDLVALGMASNTEVQWEGAPRGRGRGRGTFGSSS